MSSPGSKRPATGELLKRWDEAWPHDRLAHLVRDAGRALSRSLQLRLSEHGVSFGHWVFLRILWEADGLSQRDLAAQAGLTEPTTHSALRRMEKLGYVQRKHLSGNRKRLHLFLTARGRGLRDKLVPRAVEVNEVAVAGIDERDVETTRRTLLAMLHNLAGDETRALAQGQRVTSTQELGARSTRSRRAANGEG